MLFVGPLVAVAALAAAISVFNRIEEDEEHRADRQSVASAGTSRPAVTGRRDDKHPSLANPSRSGTIGPAKPAPTPATDSPATGTGANVSGKVDLNTKTGTAMDPLTDRPFDSNPTYNPNNNPLTSGPDRDPLKRSDKNLNGAKNGGSKSGSRKPVPSAEAQQKSLKQLKEVLKNEYAQAKTPEGQLELARKLGKLAGETSDDAAAQYVMAMQGLDMAVKYCDPRLASDFVAGLSTNFDLDGWDLRVKTLLQLCQIAKKPETRALLAQGAYGLVDTAIAENQFDHAIELATASMNLAAAIKNFPLREQAREAGERAKQLQKQSRDYAAASEKLATEPNNVDANLIVGRFQCFVDDDWDSGLPRLVKGSDGPLHEVALQEMKFPPTDPTAQMNVADLWWELAEKSDKHDDIWSKAYRARAAHWYQAALPRQSGLAAVKAQKRIDEAKAAAAISPRPTAGGKKT